MIYRMISSPLFACSQTIVYMNICSLQDCLILQEELNSIAYWEVDFSTTVTLHYSHRQILHNYIPHQQNLDNVQFQKYSTIENMDWDQHISKTSGFLRRNLASKGCIQIVGTP